MAHIGPVLLENISQRYQGGGRISTIQWVSIVDSVISTGDFATLRHTPGGDLLWQGYYPDVVGAFFGPEGVHFLNGFQLERLDAGIVLVYLLEKF